MRFCSEPVNGSVQGPTPNTCIPIPRFRYALWFKVNSWFCSNYVCQMLERLTLCDFTVRHCFSSNITVLNPLLLILYHLLIKTFSFFPSLSIWHSLPCQTSIILKSFLNFLMSLATLCFHNGSITIFSLFSSHSLVPGTVLCKEVSCHYLFHMHEHTSKHYLRLMFCYLLWVSQCIKGYEAFVIQVPQKIQPI